MISIEFNPLTSLIIIDVELEYDTKHTFKMALDTGASCTLITSYAATVLGYKFTKLPTSILFTASNKETVYQLELKSISIQTERINGIVARCMPLPSELKIDGLLGLNFLRHFNINLNFEKGIITFERITAGSIVLD